MKVGGPKSKTEQKLFGKWGYDDIKVSDKTLEAYITFENMKTKVWLPHTAGRYQRKKFRKANCPIIERIANSLMMHGRNSGKKQKTIKTIKQSLEIINLLTNENPLNSIVKAIENSGAREDSTRIGGGGVARRQAVDVSPLRRVNQAIFYLCKGARDASFRKIKSLPECLAEEFMNASKVIFLHFHSPIGICQQSCNQKEGRN
jgi:small subunit ribosomal protein S5e